MNFLKRSSTKNYSKQTRINNVYAGGKEPRKLRNTSKDKTIKNAKNLFKLKKESKGIKNRIIGDMKNFFEQKKDYYKPVSIGNFYGDYIEYECNGDSKKIQSIKEQFYINKPYLRQA